MSIRKCQDLGSRPFLQGFWILLAGFLDLDPTKKVFEHFLIDILCCLNILNKISKIKERKKHTVTLS